MERGLCKNRISALSLINEPRMSTEGRAQLSSTAEGTRDAPCGQRRLKARLRDRHGEIWYRPPNSHMRCTSTSLVTPQDLVGARIRRLSPIFKLRTHGGNSEWSFCRTPAGPRLGIDCLLLPEFGSRTADGRFGSRAGRRNWGLELFGTMSEYSNDIVFLVIGSDARARARARACLEEH